MNRSGRVHQVRQPGRQRGPDADRLLDRIGEFRRDARWPSPRSARHAPEDAPAPPRSRSRCADRRDSRTRHAGGGSRPRCPDRPAGSRGTRSAPGATTASGDRHAAGRPKAAHRMRRWRPGSRSSNSNSSRSKFELTWMSIDGDSDGSTGAIDMSLLSRNRVRISLRFDPTMKRATGRPIRRAAQAARTLPKLPVGTEKATSRSGAPSARAAAT